MRSHRFRSALAALVSLAAFAGTALGQGKPAAPMPLGQAATEALAARFTAADHWVQKAVTLLSLNTWWHPAGASMITAALRDKDPRLVAFGLEALLRAEPTLMPSVATSELLDELIVRQLARNNELLGKRVLLALKGLAPKVDATDRAAWQRWWNETKATWAPEAWTAREQPTGGEGTVAASQRAFDLYQTGLDMVICIDSTGSMQPTIDALGAALGDMVDILDGISPKMRLAIVHYKDSGELGKTGAKVVQPFNKNIKVAQENLDDLRAFGGGDLPEAVLGGLEQSLDPKLGWKKDANKLVVLIGDAPPHPADRSKAVELVRAAHETPGVPVGKPTTGPKPADTPFLTSCIGVVVNLEGKLREQPGYREFVDSQKVMREDFAAIAKAGGGVYVEVEFTFTDQPPPPKEKKDKGKEKDKDKARDAGNAIASAATRRIVEHILVLSFGERFAAEMREFVRIYYDYKTGGLIK
jgi:von Willebrand factor type A domain